MSDLKDLLAYVCKVHKTILLDVQVPGLPKAGHLLEALTRLRTEPLPHEVADFLRHTFAKLLHGSPTISAHWVSFHPTDEFAKDTGIARPAFSPGREDAGTMFEKVAVHLENLEQFDHFEQIRIITSPAVLITVSHVLTRGIVNAAKSGRAAVLRLPGTGAFRFGATGSAFVFGDAEEEVHIEAKSPSDAEAIDEPRENVKEQLFPAGPVQLAANAEPPAQLPKSGASASSNWPPRMTPPRATGGKRTLQDRSGSKSSLEYSYSLSSPLAVLTKEQEEKLNKAQQAAKEAQAEAESKKQTETETRNELIKAFSSTATKYGELLEDGIRLYSGSYATTKEPASASSSAPSSSTSTPRLSVSPNKNSHADKTAGLRKIKAVIAQMEQAKMDVREMDEKVKNLENRLHTAKEEVATAVERAQTAAAEAEQLKAHLEEIAALAAKQQSALQMVNEATFEAVEANAAADRASRKSARFCAVAAQISKKIEEAAKKHKKQETDETATR
eukprot:g18467.t1